MPTEEKNVVQAMMVRLRRSNMTGGKVIIARSALLGSGGGERNCRREEEYIPCNVIPSKQATVVLVPQWDSPLNK